MVPDKQFIALLAASEMSYVPVGMEHDAPTHPVIIKSLADRSGPRCAFR